MVKTEASVDEIRAAAMQPLPPVQNDPEPEESKAKPRRKHTLHPRNEWVLIRKTSLDEEVTEAGVILNREQVKLHQGVIVEAGWKAWLLGARKGERVMYSAFGMNLDDIELLTGDPNLFLIRHEEIYAEVRETDEFIENLFAPRPSVNRIET